MIKKYIILAERFFSWWGSQLLAMIPEKYQYFISVGRSELVYSCLPEGIHVDWEKGPKSKEFGFFPNDEKGIRAYQALFTKHPNLQLAKQTLILGDKQYLTRLVSLPPQASSNLSEVTGFEMNRFTPFESDQVFFDVNPIVSSRSAEALDAQLAFVPKKILLDLMSTLKGFTIHPTKVCFSNEHVDGHSFNLLPDFLYPAIEKKSLIISACFALLCCLQFYIILAYPGWSAEGEISRLQRQIISLNTDAKEVDAIRSKINHYQEQSSTLLAMPNHKHRVINTVKEISFLLPNDTWLNKMQVTPKTVQIQGYSNNATDLIKLLDDSPLLKDTKFRSPLAKKKNSQQAFKILSNLAEN